MTAALPAFATRPATVTRRLLLLSYHFPPSVESGALRWQKLARFAAERGWGLDVIALRPADLLRRDDARLRDLPPGMRLFGIPRQTPWLDRVVDRQWERWKARRTARGSAAGDGAHVAGAMRGGVGSLGRDDAVRAPRSKRDCVRAYHAWREYARDGAWARAAAAVGCTVARAHTHAAVISCGPPHMAHEAARLVAARSGVPLIVDLRDPWTLVQRLPEHLASPVWYGLAARHERRVVRGAALVVMNTEPAARAMAVAYPEAAGRVIAVPNGCDDEEAVPRPARRDRFVIAYAGTIYLDRDPGPLFRAVGCLVREERPDPECFGVELMGEVSEYDGASLTDLARAAGVAPYLRLHAPRPRREALAFLAQASVLVCLPQDSSLAIPAKLFDYLCLDGWIVALAERDSAVERLLRDTTAAVVALRDEQRLLAVLRDRFRRFQRGERPERSRTEVVPFSRAVQAATLFDAIEAVIGGAGRGRQTVSPGVLSCAAS